jgi:cell division protein FtsQ
MSLNGMDIKRILGVFAWTIIGAATVFLLVAAAQRKDQAICKAIEINISGVSNNFFIDKQDVLRIIRRHTGNSIEGKKIQAFSLRKIEAELKKDVWIRNAELFFDNNNVLQADIDEREPVARIFSTGGSSFYIDSSLMRLPLSEKFSARVPVFSGFRSDAIVLSKADSVLLRSVLDISLELMSDEFMMAMVDQVDITPEGNFELLPKFGKHLIVFGDATNARGKFEKMKLFYKNVVMRSGWNKYSTISLQYHNQVVAKIRGKEDIAEDSIRTLQLMKMIAENAAKAAADSAQSIVPDTEKNTADTSLIQQSLQRDEIAEPSISNTIEKPTPQEKPLSIKPVPERKPAVKAGTAKQVVKKTGTKAIPKAVMKGPAKANDY